MKLQALDPLLYPDHEDQLYGDSKFIDHLENLIRQSVKPPFAISIDGLWGTGKTTVMQLLQNRLGGQYEITSERLEALREKVKATQILEPLQDLKGQKFQNEKDFIETLHEVFEVGVLETQQKELLQQFCINEEQVCPTFWFNPWEYQDAESIVLAFLQRFAAEMKP